MSSLAVRTQIKSFLSTEFPSEKVSDLSGGWLRLDDHLAIDSIAMSDDWIGLQFIGNDEVPITVSTTNTQGRYRENGAVYIHVVGVVKSGVRDSILTRAEAIKNKIRGQRFGNITILSASPPNFELGATIEFEDGFISASMIVEYENEINL